MGWKGGIKAGKATIFHAKWQHGDTMASKDWKIKNKRKHARLDDLQLFLG